MGEVNLTSLPLQIEDYGLIGDMRTCALVGKNGSIDYMCWPKFDSPSTFCRILDTSQGGGGHWSISPRQSTVCKQNYRASSNILQTKWIDEDGVVDLTDFFALSKYNKVLKGSGSTLVRKLDCVRGSMSIDIELCPKPGYARSEGSMKFSQVHAEGDTYSQSLSWVPADPNSSNDTPEFFISYCTHDRPLKTAPTMFRIEGSTNDTIHAHFELQEGQRIIMVMCNKQLSPHLNNELFKTLEDDTYKFWTNWIRACHYRGRFQQEVERSMLVLKLLTYDPTGAIVAAPTFSLPEAIGGPRNWDYRFSWVRDSSFTICMTFLMHKHTALHDSPGTNFLLQMSSSKWVSQPKQKHTSTSFSHASPNGAKWPRLRQQFTICH